MCSTSCPQPRPDSLDDSPGSGPHCAWISAVARLIARPYGSSCPKGPSERSGEARGDPAQRRRSGRTSRKARTGQTARSRDTTGRDHIKARRVPGSAPFVVGSFGRFRVRGIGSPEHRSTLRRCRARCTASLPDEPRSGDFPGIVEVVVEIPRGSRNKYEFDEEAGSSASTASSSSAVFYNFDYGFISDTRAGDGDHTDALLLIDEPTFPGCRVWARPIGGLEMRDEKGFDFKVLCVAVADPHQAHVERLAQVRPHRLIEIEHFFQTYKLLEDKATEVVGWRDAAQARAVLVADRTTGRPNARRPAGHRAATVDATAPVRRRAAGRGGDGRRRRRRRTDPGDGARGSARPLGASRWAPPHAPLPRPDAGGARARARRRRRGRRGDAEPFTITIRGAGAFPSPGGRGRSGSACATARTSSRRCARLDDRLAGLGWPLEDARSSPT